REHRLIWAEEGRYRFDHARVRDVVYDSLEQVLCQEYHLVIGTQMLEEFGEERDYQGPIARHFLRSGHPREALPFLVRAADNARRLFANQDALETYREILRLVEALPAAQRAQQRETILAAVGGRGEVEMLLGDLPAAMASFEELK